MVSLTPKRTLSTAVTNAHRPPITMPANAMSGSSSALGMFGVNSAKKDAAKAPMIIWPSAPIFQNFIRNAREMPRDVMTSGTARITVSLKL